MEAGFAVFALSIAIIFMIAEFWLVPVTLLIKGLTAGIPVTPLQIIGMRLRGVDPHIIVNSAVALIMSKAPLSDYEKSKLILLYESHFLAGGNVARVTAAMIKAMHREESLTLNQAFAIDLDLSHQEQG